jgi:hypothetical protein
MKKEKTTLWHNLYKCVRFGGWQVKTAMKRGGKGDEESDKTTSITIVMHHPVSHFRLFFMPLPSLLDE